MSTSIVAIRSMGSPTVGFAVNTELDGRLDTDGDKDGCLEGLEEATLLGRALAPGIVGRCEGATLGTLEGLEEATLLGVALAPGIVGSCEGATLGSLEGAMDGFSLELGVELGCMEAIVGT